MTDALKAEFPELEDDVKKELQEETGEVVGQEEVADQEEAQSKKEDIEVEPQEETTEDRARKKGWKPYDEWVEAGNDPNEWSGASRFLELGRLIHKNRELERQVDNFDQRLNRVSQFHEMELKRKIKDLEERKRAAVEMADVEQFDRLQEEERELHQTTQQANQQAVHPDVQLVQALSQYDEFQTFITRNADIINDPARAQQVIPLIKQYGRENPSHSVAQTLDYVERSLKTPHVNSNREKAKIPEKGKRAPVGVKKKLTMADLTTQEAKFYEDFKGEMSKEEFLQMVQDVRDGKGD